MDLSDFHRLLRARRATRHFKPDPLPDHLLNDLINAARWAPSGYNLQPTQFVVVDDAKLKPTLCKACLGQRQVLEAPATVVFVGDRRVASDHLERVLQADRDAGAIDDDYEQRLRAYVRLAFGHDPVGLGWLWKAFCPPLVRPWRPVPSIPAVHKRYWLAKQVTLSAMAFMLAATAAGLATCPMEGFDESRVRRVLGIPRHGVVCLMTPVGYAADSGPRKTRLPLAALIHYNRWSSRCPAPDHGAAG